MKALDLTRFRKGITKSIAGISTGFRDPSVWIPTGNYALNFRISGDFNKGVPLGKVTILAGESGSGKSFIASGNLVREAQKQDIFVVLIDSENALDENWLHALGVDTSEDKMLMIHASMIDDVAAIINNFMNSYKADYADEPEDTRPKVLFVIDSLGMLMSPTEIKQFQDGDMKGDFGRKAKQLKALVTNCVNMFGEFNIGMIATNHTYASQDMFDPDDKISGGSGPIYAASIVLALKKLKLKEDEAGNKTRKVSGIRAKCKIMKSRFAKPFEEVEIKIPWDRGMDPYSGLFELFVDKELITKPQGNKYIYFDKEGTEHKYFEKGFKTNQGGILDIIMNEYDALQVEIDLTPDEEETDA